MQSSDYGFLEQNSNGSAIENCGHGSPIANAVQSPASYSTSDESPVSINLPYTFEQEQPRRTVSREGSGPLRHPTPDLQSLQGAYIGNVERLEQSAERLSLSSDIGEELRRMNLEQRKSKSRSSSIRAVQMGQPVGKLLSMRQVSAGSNMSNSILDLNNIARAGGLPPNGHFISPAGSLSSPSWSLHSPRPRQKILSERVTRTSDLDPEEHPSNAPAFTSFDTDADISQQSLQVTEHEIMQHPVTLQKAGIALLPTELQHDLLQATTEFPERPVTAVSTDSHRQDMHLFADFDGVHIPSHYNQPPRRSETGKGSENVSNLSLQEPLPINDHSIAREDLSRAQDMVYYPAPVPVMLNLPQKLSKGPRALQRDSRRSEMPDTAPIPAARNPTLALSEMLKPQNEGYGARNIDNERHRSMADLPPQLKAELFFEHKPVQQNIELKGGSAVATLDSILDASAHAPVNAFIDHPIAGHVGAEIFGKSSLGKSINGVGATCARPRESRSLLNILKHRSSSATLLESKRHSSLFGPDSLSTGGDPSASYIEGRTTTNDAETSELIDNEEQTGDAEDIVENGADGEVYVGVPTTLLAELQIRKQQQQQRGRTAAKALPNGMYSTLLELDAVAQVQKQTRKQKPVTLAWEDSSAQHYRAKNQSDEDVPLGVLYPSHRILQSKPSGYLDEDQPLGLVAKRTMDDNEPLSQRRARLRGESEIPRDTISNKCGRMYPLEETGLTEHYVGISTEEDGETLAQRLKRLKDVGQKSPFRPLSDDFMSEVMSSVGIPLKTAKGTEVPVSRTPNPEEKLSQRRKRLQAEKEALFRKGNRDSINPRASDTKRHTMGCELQACHPDALRTIFSESISSGPVLAGPAGGLLYQDPNVHSPSFGTVNQTLSDTLMDGYGFALPVPGPQNTHVGNVAHPLATAPTSQLNPMVFTTNAMKFPESADLSLKSQAPISGSGREPIIIDLKQRAMIDRWRQSVV